MLAGSIENGKLINSKITLAGNDVSLGGSLSANTLRTSLGLSNALHFIGIATVTITDGSTTDPKISGYTTKTSGDVIIDKDSAYEYVWTGSKWEKLGGDGSYKVVQSAVSSPSASGTEISFIDTISQNANGVITATKKTVRDASASQSGVVNTGAQTFAGIKTFTDPIRIGSDPNGRGKNYIAFYGTTGDNAGNFNHAYIGENLWGSSESSELVLFKGNDIGADATTVSASGPDRIRHIAGAHLFQTYASALSGTFSDICTSTVPTNIFAINNTNTKHYVDALPATNNTRTLGSASLRWKALLVGTADSYGSATKPIYWNAGVPTACNSTIGSSTKGMYLNAGTMTAMAYNLGANIYAYSGSLASGGWKILHGKSDSPAITIAYNNGMAAWNSSTYSASMVFGCEDTRGLLDLAYNSPIVTFGGTSFGSATDDNPNWYFKLKGTSGQTYTFPTSSKTLCATDGSNASGTWGISISGNAATASYTTQLLGVNSSNTPYNAVEGNLIRAVWNVKGDNRWYLKARTYNCRVNCADNADTVDGYHESSFLRYRYTVSGSGGTSHSNSLWSKIGIRQYNNALPDAMADNATYTYGAVISLPGAESRLDIWYNHQTSSNGNGLRYRTGWNNDKKAWSTILDSSNYTSYTVTKTGGGASGTWGINITGNASTATKATQDSDGNAINTTYLKKTDLKSSIINTDGFGKTYTFTKTVAIGTNWTSVGIASANLPSGVYIVYMTGIWDTDKSWQDSNIYAGIMSWYNGGTNSSERSEILLHTTGHAHSKYRIFLSTLSHMGNPANSTTLEIKSNITFTRNTTITFKFVKMV